MASAHAHADAATLVASMHAPAARSRAGRRTIQPTHIDDEEQTGSGERKSAADESAVPSDCIDLTDETEEQSSTSALPPQPHQSARAALIGSAHARAAKRKHAEHSGGDDADEHSASGSSGVAVPARSAAPRRTASRLAASHGVPLLQRNARGPLAAADGDDVSEESEEDEEWEERKRPSTKRRGRPPANAGAGAASTAAAAAAAPSRPAAPSPPPLPFIFNPAHLPDAATRAASDRAVQQRFQNWLADSVPVGKTTSQQRNRMPKDLLLQRNLEIQGQCSLCSVCAAPPLPLLASPRSRPGQRPGCSSPLLCLSHCACLYHRRLLSRSCPLAPSQR